MIENQRWEGQKNNKNLQSLVQTRQPDGEKAFFYPV